MTSTAEHRRGWLALAAVGLLVAAPGTAAPGAAAPETPKRLIGEAGAQLARGDGIAAEVALRHALEAGAAREAVAARMGEALLDQGNLLKAREWLGPGKFTAAEALRGWRMLGQLELASGDLAAAGRAYDRAVALAPRDAQLWTDIARLRYAGGEHLQAVGAVDHALELDPAHPRALEFRALIVRDQIGGAAALRWFEAGLARAPKESALLAGQAATLADLGRAVEAVAVTRRLLDVDPGNAQAYFIQATIAARAGDIALARGLYNHTGRALTDVPSAQLLQTVLELSAGNANLSAELADRLARAQPGNALAAQVLARALSASAEPVEVIARLSPATARPGASPYLLTLVARAYEDLGQRDKAAPLLDRVAAARAPLISPLAASAPVGVLALRHRDDPRGLPVAVDYVRALLAAGQGGAAQDVAAGMLAQFPGSGDAALLAGDVALWRGDDRAALDAYRRAAAVRFGRPLMQRLALIAQRGGRRDEAGEVVVSWLAAHPGDRPAQRLAADYAASTGDWPRARTLLERLVATGDARDAGVQASLAVARLRSGDRNRARAAAGAALAISPASPAAQRAAQLSR